MKDLINLQIEKSRKFVELLFSASEEEQEYDVENINTYLKNLLLQEKERYTIDVYLSKKEIYVLQIRLLNYVNYFITEEQEVYNIQQSEVQKLKEEATMLDLAILEYLYEQM